MRTEPATGGGALLFAQYAHPPNLLGYCGPIDHLAFFEQATDGVVDRGLGELAHAFDGAWPYLELIAAASRIRDPLDGAVVHAYWVGSPLLERVDMASSAARSTSGSAGAWVADGSTYRRRSSPVPCLTTASTSCWYRRGSV